MNNEELNAHNLIGRLRYLLHRLEAEFFHIHPDLTKNGQVTSLALSSILNEALNIQEACFQGNMNFWNAIKDWGQKQDWDWSTVEIRFTRWPTMEIIKPFNVLSSDKLQIEGRDANNLVKHSAKLGSLYDTLNACAVAWFLVLEIAREASIYFDSSDLDNLFGLFDCYDWIDIRCTEFGVICCRPSTRVQYPCVRGQSEEAIAIEKHKQRFEKWEKIKKSK